MSPKKSDPLKKTNSAAALLREALANLKSNSNGLISIRSLAKSCDVSPSYLSKIVRGDKPIPPILVKVLSKIFKLDVTDSRELQKRVLQAYELKKVASETGFTIVKNENGDPLKDYLKLPEKYFFILEKWYYIPVLNIISLGPLYATEQSLSEKLGISKLEIDQCLKMLIKLGFIKKLNNGHTYERTEAKIRFPTQKSHPLVRHYHRMMLDLAKKELNKTDLESFNRRLISGINCTADPKKIPEALALLNKAIYEAAEILMSGDKTGEVFQINIQMFGLTK